MKDICLDITGCRALGDTLCVTPTIRKLYKSYNRKVSVITNIPELFVTNPYVENIFDGDVNRDKLKETYDIFETSCKVLYASSKSSVYGFPIGKSSSTNFSAI